MEAQNEPQQQTTVLDSKSQSIQDLQKFQNQLRQTQNIMMETLKPQNTKDFMQTSLQNELEKISDQLANERLQNSKLSADLSRSLELNLKLQFEVEEIRLKANQLLKEEQSAHHQLADKFKKIDHELELMNALNSDLRVELARAKDTYQAEIDRHSKEQQKWVATNQSLTEQLSQSERSNKLLEQAIEDLREDKVSLLNSLEDFKKHAEDQNHVLKTMSELAQAKMLEVQAALHKKSAESRDYQSHLQQALTQLDILKQENATLKDYFNKLSKATSASQNNN